MARYDRVFLVPYLRDICCLQLAQDKTEDMIRAARSEAEYLQREALRTVTPPNLEAYKNRDDPSAAGYGCLAMFCLLLAGVCFIAVFMAHSLWYFLGVIASLAASFYVMACGEDEPDRLNEEIRERNQKRQLDHSIREIAALAAVQPEVDIIDEKIQEYHQKIENIETILQTLYSIDLIPRWYRELYPAVYLDDWFSSGRSDDLELAISAYQPEQMRDGVIDIIRHRSRELLDQRIIHAKQYEEREQREQHYRELADRIDAMTCDDEERSIYVRMMNGNMVANAYFSAADYLKK